MGKNAFENDLELTRRFGKEKVGGGNFESYLSGEEEYFKILDHMIAVMIPWKKNYHPNQIREHLIFNYRRFKSYLRKLEKQPALKKGTVFFLPISETNTMFFEPIIKKLITKTGVKVLRFDYSLNGIKKELIKRKLPYVNFEKYLDKTSLRGAREIRKRYRKAFEIAKIILKRNKEYEELKPVIKYYFGVRNRFYEILEFIAGLKNFIRIEKPSMIVVPDETMDIVRATSYICKKMKIPCISMQSGNMINESPESGETFAIKKTVFGPFARKKTIERGMSSKKIVVTGSPLYDVIFKKKMSKKKINDKKKKLGLIGKTVVLFASTTNLDIAKKRLNILFKIANKNPNLKVIVKQHPGEYQDKRYEKFYRALAKKYKINIIVSKEDMWKMLSLSDIYITDISTTILEALILRKAIILTNFEKFYDYEPYPEKKGVIWHAYNFKDVDMAIKHILHRKPGEEEEAFRKKLIEDNLYKVDGKSTERVCKLIEKLKLKN
ncbi:MAG: CDP-glycerol glycerophosphotransferase family protein [Nanoarchaeota archaeon]|nr:CDP-glycerol glycerophosphotransferase family protein [Nanoarchaeota archaeon]